MDSVRPLPWPALFGSKHECIVAGHSRYPTPWPLRSAYNAIPYSVAELNMLLWQCGTLVVCFSHLMGSSNKITMATSECLHVPGPVPSVFHESSHWIRTTILEHHARTVSILNRSEIVRPVPEGSVKSPDGSGEGVLLPVPLSLDGIRCCFRINWSW